MDIVSVKGQKWSDNKLKLELEGVLRSTETYWVHVPKGYVPNVCKVEGVDTCFELIGEALRIEVNFKRVNTNLDIDFKCI